jgi:hypothetical protein
MMLFSSLVVAVIALPIAPDEKPAAPPAGVKVKLTISAQEFDPSKPSKAFVRVVVENKSDAAIAVGVGYDGKTNVLEGTGERLRWELSLFPFKRDVAVKTSQVSPGKELQLFELPLDEILFQGQAENVKASERKWGWTWIARPAPPRSPIHAMRGKGYVPSATFRAIVSINGKPAASEKVTLKVKGAETKPE